MANGQTSRITLEINASGAVSVLSQVGGAVESLGTKSDQAAAKMQSAFGQTGAAAQQAADKIAAGFGTTIDLLEKQIAIQQQALSGTLSYADALQKLAEVQLVSKGATEEQAAQLVTLQAAYKENEAALLANVEATAKEAAAQAETATQYGASLALLEQKIAIQKEALAGSTSFAAAEEKIAAAELIAKGATAEEAAQLTELQAKYKENVAAIEEAKGANEGILGSFTNLGETVKTLVETFILFETIIKTFETIKGVVETGAEFAQLSQRVAISTETLSGYSLAAQTVNVSNDSLARGLQLFSKNIEAAQKGTGAQAEAFKALGINIRDADGNIKPTSDLLTEVANAFHGAEDSAAKTTIAITLFGRAGAALIPFLNQGGAAIKSMSELAKELGLVWSEQDAQAAEELHKAITILEASFTGLIASVIKPLIPGLVEIANSMVKLVASNREWISSGIVKGFQDAKDAAVGFLPPMTSILSVVGDLVKLFTSLPTVVQETGLLLSFTFGKTPIATVVAALAIAKTGWESLSAAMEHANQLQKDIQQGSPLGPSNAPIAGPPAPPPPVLDQSSLATLKLAQNTEFLDQKVVVARTDMDGFAKTLDDGAKKQLVFSTGTDKSTASLAEAAKAAAEAAKTHADYLKTIAELTGTQSASEAAFQAEIAAIKAQEAAKLAEAQKTAKEAVKAAQDQAGGELEAVQAGNTAQIEAQKNLEKQRQDIIQSSNNEILKATAAHIEQQIALIKQQYDQQKQLADAAAGVTNSQLQAEATLVTAKQSQIDAEQQLAQIQGTSAEQDFAFIQRKLEGERQLLDIKQKQDALALSTAQDNRARDTQELAAITQKVQGFKALLDATGHLGQADEQTYGKLQQQLNAAQIAVDKDTEAVTRDTAAVDANGVAYQTLQTKGVAAYQQLQAAAAQTAFINTSVISDMVTQIGTGILQGTQSLSGLIGAAGQSLALRFGQQFIQGKNQHLDIPFIGNISQLVFGNNGGLIGNLFGQGGQLAATNFASGFQGIGATILQGGASATIQSSINANSVNWGASAAQTFASNFSQGVSQIFSGGNLSGGLSQIAQGFTGFLQNLGGIGGGLLGFGAGDLFSTLLGINSSNEAKLGGQIGGFVGGAIGIGLTALTGIPGLSFVGSFLGDLAGSIFGGLFAHTPTSGTLIRAGVADWLKQIGVSFADQIDSGNYFFDETKAMAKALFGGDFLAASKQELINNAGPQLAKELQALGTFITADQADKLGKSLEQTGTTFGNMLIANLGIDKIPAAIQEIIQKGNITFGPLLEKLAEEFNKGSIGVKFFKDAIEGAADLFLGGWPKMIDLQKEIDNAMVNGKLDVQKFEQEIQNVAGLFQATSKTAVDAFTQGIANNLSGSDVAKNFTDQFMAGIRDSVVAAAAQAAVGAAFTQAFTDALLPVQQLIKDFAAGKLTFDEFSTKFTAAMEAAKPQVKALADALGLSEDKTLKLLKDAGLLPDAFNKASAAGGNLANALATSLHDGMLKGLSASDLTKNLHDTFMQTVGDAILQGVTTGLINAALDSAALSGPLSQIGDLIDQYVSGSISFDDFSTKLTAVFTDLGPELDRMATALGVSGERLHQVLSDLHLLPDAAQQAGTQMAAALGKGISTAITDAVTKGLTGQDLLQHTESVIKKALADAVLQGMITGFVNAALAEPAVKAAMEQFQGIIDNYLNNKIDLNTFKQRWQAAMSAAGPVFDHIAQTISVISPEFASWLQTIYGITPAANSVKGALAGLSDEAASVVTQIQQINQQIAQLENKRIQIKIDLISNLQSIGAINGTDAANQKILLYQQQLSQLQSSQGYSSIATNPLISWTDQALQAGIDTIDQLKGAWTEFYSAQKSAIDQEASDQIAAIQTSSQAQITAVQTAAQAQIDAINKATQAQQQAIQDSYQKQQDAITAQSDALNAQKQKEQQASQDRLTALNKELATAQAFKQLSDSIKGTLANLATGAQSPLSKTEQEAFLQRQAISLRQQIGGASLENQPALIQQLVQNLQQQLSVTPFQNVSVQGVNQFNSIIKELTALQQKSATLGDRATIIQQQIEAETKQQTALQQDIDAQLKGLQKQSQALQKQEQADLKALQDKAQAQIDAINQKAKDDVTAITNSANAQIQAVKDWQARETQNLQTLVADNLKALTKQENDLLNEQIRRLQAQVDILKPQLDAMVGTQKSAALLADPSVGLLYTTAQTNTLIGAMDINIGTSLGTVNDNLGVLHTDLLAFLANVKPAASGYHAINTTASHMFLTHPGEDISITRHNEDYAVPVRGERGSHPAGESAGGRDGDINVNFNLGDIKTYMQSSGYVFRDAQQFTSALRTYIIQDFRAGGPISSEVSRFMARKSVGRR